MRKLINIAALLGLAASLGGCKTVVIRNISAQMWAGAGDGIYVAYWEGVCGFFGCDQIGDSKIQWCSLQENNSITCEPQEAADAVLNPHRSRNKK